jgi:hypothetical protein
MTVTGAPRRVPVDDFRALPLRVHALLADVPLKDVMVVDLIGGGAGRSLGELRTLPKDEPGHLRDRLTRALFGLRRGLGRVFGWDAVTDAGTNVSFRQRLPADILASSRTEAGTRYGPLDILYELADESLSEGRNATAHAFLCQALLPVVGGYRLYWAVYVQPVSWFTSVYLSMIEPFRRFIVYPALLSALSRAWTVRYGQ